MFGMHPVIKHGSESMKKRYLPDVASGKLQVAFGVTEPNAGSDTTQSRPEQVWWMVIMS